MYELLKKAAAELGTPLYAYDLSRIDENIELLRKGFGQDVEIHFACKALPNSRVLRYLRGRGCGIDAVSVEELRIALNCGYRPEDINFTPSGAHFDEYVFALEQGISVHVDNVGVLEKLGRKSPGLRVALRINPGVAGGAHDQLQVGADGSKFGLYPQEWDRVEEIVRQFDIEVRRVHVHVGSDVHTTEEFVKTWRRGFRYAERYAETVKILDLGGGFGVPYGPGKDPVDIDLLGKAVHELQQSYFSATGHRPGLMIEPGKYVSATAGFFVVEVTALKELKEKTIVFVNSGFNHLIRPMYYGATHHIENLSTPEAPVVRQQVSGYLCETDTFTKGYDFPQAKTGDLLLFHNAGAYGFSMASNYNSRVRPAEIVFRGNAYQLARRRETLDDILITEQIPEDSSDL